MVLLRVFLFVVILVVGFYGSLPFYDFLTNDLGYKETCSGFCAFEGFGIGILALILSYSFWVGIVFGALGKKADYIFIGSVFLLILYLFAQETEKKWELLISFIILAVISNAIGFVLKILRQKFLVRK